MKELTMVFHKHDLLVTQDVPANDKAFDYSALAKNNRSNDCNDVR